jgi:AAA15 family ATPase/GTPase
MNLRTVYLKNFRAYKEETSVNIDELTAFLGKNDIGKSSILEALEIFFNNSTVKIDQDDLNIESKREGNYSIEIACEFTSLPTPVTIDTNSNTTLKDEYLSYSNEYDEECLRVVKRFDSSKKTIKSETIIASPNYPIKEDLNDLHTLKITELRKRAGELNIDLSGVDERNSSAIRKAIWNQSNLSTEDFGFAEISADNDEYGKKIWKSLAGYLPFYALFQSDRPSTDGDNEVQDPIKVAIGQAVKKVENKLIEIETEVESEVKDTLNRTSAKLKDLAPDWDHDEGFLPEQSKAIRWANNFKYQLLGSDEIPINKRGSGMRRLILLAFFQAEADRRMRESDVENIIYAIEEPETSQHPDHQIKLIQSFQNLSEQPNTQILLTTHVPGLAQMVASHQIRFIIEDAGRKKIGSGDQLIKKAADSLGVLPDPNNTVRVIIHVEGKHDVAFLKRASEVLYENGEIDVNLNSDNRFVVLPVGGSSLKDYVNLQYLKSLNKTEFHLYDSDDPSYQSEVDKVNARDNDDYATLTIKREIENYIPPQLFEEFYATRNIDINLPDEFLDDEDVPELVSRHVYEVCNPDNSWEDCQTKSNYHRRVKKRVHEDILPLLTLEHFDEVDAIDEMKSWFNRMEELAH